MRAAVVEVAEAEPGEVGEDYEEDGQGDGQQDGKDESANECLHDEMKEVRCRVEIVAGHRAHFRRGLCNLSELG